MLLLFDERPSDSPFVERIWRTRSERDGPFSSVAMSQWEMVVTRHHGLTTLMVRGPETRATPQDCPAGGEWVGIRFKLGTVMPHLPASSFVDGAVTLPEAGSRAFWLQGSAWHFPDYENADTFVARLVRDGLLVRDPVVAAALRGQPRDLSPRTAQRHFLRTSGLAHSTVRQIERARFATILLRQGLPILEVIHEAGYFDRAHLTRSLKRYIGQTPAQLRDLSRAGQLSFLYKAASIL